MTQITYHAALNQCCGIHHEIQPRCADCITAPIAEAWSWIKDPEDPTLLDVCQGVSARSPSQQLLTYLADTLGSGRGATNTDIHCDA